ncbi:MAG: hypothetical protein Q9209_002748 [Squamulea sp. 1 TL-2023]
MGTKKSDVKYALEKLKVFPQQYEHVMKDIEARTRLKEVFNQLEHQRGKIDWNTAGRFGDDEDALLELLSLCDYLDNKLKKRIIRLCQEDANRFIDEREDLAKRTDDKTLHYLIEDLGTRASQISNPANQNVEDWDIVSRLIHDYWDRESSYNQRRKALGL